MFATFWETIFKEQYQGRNINVLPALLFWIGGLIVWFDSKGWDLNFLWGKLENLQNFNYTQIGILLFTFILLIAVSHKFGEWLQLPLTKFIEGYWPFPLSVLARYLVKKLEFKIQLKEIERNTLAKKYKILNYSEKKRFIELEAKLDQYPLFLLLPTRFGNIIRAAEEYPSDRYGLETIRVWPNLWLLMSDKMREELSAANKIISDRVTLFFWSSVFCVWTLVAFIKWNSLVLWPLFVSILEVPFVYYMGLIPAASNFRDLLRASFDLHRFDLYKALHLPLPSNPNNEDKDGESLSQYLKRGIYPYSNSVFTHFDIKKDAENK